MLKTYQNGKGEYRGLGSLLFDEKDLVIKGFMKILKVNDKVLGLMSTLHLMTKGIGRKERCLSMIPSVKNMYELYLS